MVPSNQEKKAQACLKITKLSKTKSEKQRFSQISYKNITAGASFYSFIKKETLWKMFYYELCEVFIKSFM